MKSANALLCVPRGDGEIAEGQQLPAILIGDLPPLPSSRCHLGKVRARQMCQTDLTKPQDCREAKDEQCRCQQALIRCILTLPRSSLNTTLLR